MHAAYPSKSPPARHDAKERSPRAYGAIRGVEDDLILRTNSRKNDDILQATEEADLVIGRPTHCGDPLYYDVREYYQYERKHESVYTNHRQDVSLGSWK